MSTIRKLVFVAVATAIVLPAAAFAQLSKDEQKCIDKYNNFGRLVGQQGGTSARTCIKNAGKAKESNPDNCIVNNTDGKIAGKEAKVSGIFTDGTCTGSEPIQQGAPAANAALSDMATDLAHDIFGDPVNPAISTDKVDAKCQDKAFLRAEQLATEKLKNFRSCKKDGMKSAAITNSATLQAACLPTSGIPDPKGKIAGKQGKLADDVVASCQATTSSLASLFPGECASAATAGALAVCIEQRVECQVCLALNAADGTNTNCDLFDDSVANGSCGGYPAINIGNHQCTLGGTPTESFMTLHAALPLPSFSTAGAKVDFSCGTTAPDGKAPCNCSVNTFPPLLIAGIFWACVNPPTGTCPAGEIDCNGGNAMGLSLVGNHNIGPCTSNANCASQCTTKCATTGSVPFGTNGGQCEGFCTDGAQSPCTLDSQCLALAQGSCNGPDGAGFGNICDCTCLADSGGPAGAAGELSCQLAFNLTVEPNPGNGIACDGADTSINVGPACAPLTTAGSSGIINNANNAGGTFPAGGPFSDTGAAANCATLQSSTMTGVRLVGSSVFYGSTIGDIDAQIGAKCN